MNTYVFEARDEHGQLVADVIAKENENEVFAHLADLRLIPTNISVTKTRSSDWKMRYRKEKIILFSELATYKRNNVPMREIAEDLRLLFKPGTKWSTILAGFLTDITGSSRLYDAMGHRTDVFSEHEIQLMKTAYAVGKEVEMLETLVRYLRRSDRVLGKIFQAMVYPLALIIGMVIALAIYGVVMLPQLKRLYTSLNIEPTFPLPLLFWFFDTVSTPLGAIGLLAGTTLLIGLVYLGFKNQRASIYLDRFVLNAPLFGELVYLQRLARTLFVLDLMLSAGQKNRAFSSALSAASGAVFRTALSRCQHEIEEGNVKKWNDVFALAPEIFSVTLIGLMRSGERNGKIAEKIKDALANAEYRVDEIIVVLPERLQTMITVVFSVLIGFLMYAMVVPISNGVAQIR